jgi:hypothetical protein
MKVAYASGITSVAFFHKNKDDKCGVYAFAEFNILKETHESKLKLMISF